jgi:polysaccharide biosynthesis transport protein
MSMYRISTFQDVLALLVRRIWLIAAVFIAFAGISVVASRIIPNAYVSETMILIQQREVPTDFVKDLISGSTDQRLTAIEQAILSRTNLLKIADQFESSMIHYRGLNDERKVDRMRKQIGIEFPSEKLRGVYAPITQVRISFRDQNPELAQKIASRLASLFIEQDSRTREDQVFGTTEFLTGELNKISDQLLQSDTKLKELKERYRYELPDQKETNLRTLDRLQLQRTANTEALDRQIAMQLNLERQLSETPQSLSKESILRGETIAARKPNPQVDVYRKKEQEYKDLLAKATEKHPDVIRMRTELESLRKDIPSEDFIPSDQPSSPKTQTSTEVNPVYQNLLGQARMVKTEIEIREREKKSIDNEIAKYSLRVQNAPRVDQEIAVTVRINSELQKQADELKGKLSQAKLSESLESKQKGAQFTIVDPASFPMEPAPPSRTMIFLYGLGISLAAGIGIGVLLDLLNRQVYTAAELERLLKSPVLVEIPKITSPLDILHARKRNTAYATIFAAAACLYICGLYLLYLKQGFLLRVLAPLVVRIRG